MRKKRSSTDILTRFLQYFTQNRLHGEDKVIKHNFSTYFIANPFLLRKIALPYPHKCLFGFVEQNVSTDKNFLRNILVTRGDPFVCACPRLRSSRCRQTIGESSSLYFWSIWEQHVFFLIIVHSRMKIYEV